MRCVVDNSIPKNVRSCAKRTFDELPANSKVAANGRALRSSEFWGRALHWWGTSNQMAVIVCPQAGDLPASPQSQACAIVASASLDTFGCIARAPDAVRIRFAQAPELCQKREFAEAAVACIAIVSLSQ
jgi:hypothetical protein